MKKKILIAIIMCFMLTACAGKEEGNGTMNSDTGLEATKDIELTHIENFHKLTKEDIIGDRKGVYWDGESASVVEDELDQSDIDDGRNVFSGATTVKLPLIFEYSYPNDLEDVTVVNDDAKDYHVTAKDYDIRIELVDYNSAVEKMAENDNFIEIDKSALSVNQTKYFDDYHLYRGIVNTEQGDYAGYVLIFESNLDDRQYKITCSGLGLVERIRMTAFYIDRKSVV